MSRECSYRLLQHERTSIREEVVGNFVTREGASDPLPMPASAENADNRKGRKPWVELPRPTSSNGILICVE